mgnify:CR=1 FL=1
MHVHVWHVVVDACMGWYVNNAGIGLWLGLLHMSSSCAVFGYMSWGSYCHSAALTHVDRDGIIMVLFSFADGVVFSPTSNGDIDQYACIGLWLGLLHMSFLCVVFWLHEVEVVIVIVLP